ncbi:MAG: hypothetical protein AVDCRST_MAG30-1336 [uncultured Solirubrobacteraceae bacterium]|uniref:Uncharacterized protein n=1 Tax=uncultured Solirubrobacteraceae bacterium TaxID=1162706 RepID=A0A6J4S622_9ACTN|nr:MAG: hypothetical protein AVDCRST_MAG30-1336 [uncultured Solirubrobacteraceae bacterium]
MALFRRRRSQAQLLAATRSSVQRPDVDAELGPLLDEVGIPARREPGGWVIDIDGATLLCVWSAEYGLLGGQVEVGRGGEPAELLRRNLDPMLAWCARYSADPESAIVTFALPLTTFERGAVLLALESVAGLTGGEALAARLRDARMGPGGGELAEQTAEREGRAAFTAALAELGLPAAERPETPGAWRVEVDRGIVEAVLRDAGDVVLLMHEIPYGTSEKDTSPEMLSWLLESSDNGARFGLVPVGGSPALFVTAAIAVPGLGPDAVAHGFERLLTLADHYDGSG